MIQVEFQFCHLAHRNDQPYDIRDACVGSKHHGEREREGEEKE